jgi:hypothetical protein
MLAHSFRRPQEFHRQKVTVGEMPFARGLLRKGGLPQEIGDFGQTLFVWGVSEGPHT